MLAITDSNQSKKTTVIPNILPCKIVHSGPIPTAKRHWNPQSSTSSPDTQTAYFRGRKLQGKTIALPEGFEGKVLLKTDSLLPSQPHVPGDEEDDDDEGVPAEVKQVEETANFSSIVVWGHEAVPDSEDAYVQGLVEWPEFAESVCSLRFVFLYSETDRKQQIHAYDTAAASTS